MRLVFGGYVAAVALAFGVASGNASDVQDPGTYSADQIERIFKKQRTRGIPALPAAPADGATAHAAEMAREIGYVAVAPDEQINVRIRFDFDSAVLRPDQVSKLATLCNVMRTIDVGLFQIIGHTDSAGTPEYNQDLSYRRAQAVKGHLINECGVDRARLQAIGVGEDALLDASNPESETNRRVEFQALG